MPKRKRGEKMPTRRVVLGEGFILYGEEKIGVSPSARRELFYTTFMTRALGIPKNQKVRIVAEFID